jgi:phosphinothricin acetyltransferase
VTSPFAPKLEAAIRDSHDGDIPAIQAIYAHWVAHSTGTFDEVAPSLAEMAERRQSVLAKGLPFLVADDDGEIMGYAYAGPFRPRSAYRYTLEDSIYVAPFVQHRGVGRLLLSALIERCTALGYQQMIAVIGDSANQGSIGLHRKLGFRQEGVLRGVGLKFGRWVDVVIMHRPLQPEGSPPPKA